MPNRHAVQELEPAASALKAPAAQAVHTSEVDALATSPYLPSTQAVQALVPVMSVLYAPAMQAVQAAEVFVAATLL